MAQGEPPPYPGFIQQPQEPLPPKADYTYPAQPQPVPTATVSHACMSCRAASYIVKVYSIYIT